MVNNDFSRATSQGAFSRYLGRLVPVWKDRPDSEHEQAVIRILVGLFFATYLIVVLLTRESVPSSFSLTVALISSFFVAGFFIIGWLLIYPGTHSIRRITGCCVDIGAATLGLYLHGNLAVPFFIVYLWVTFGNGFRFGRPYLFLSMILSLAGYSLVMFTSDNWHASPFVDIGLLVALIMLPLYVAALLKRLTSTITEAERANKAKSNFLAIMSHEIRTPLFGVMGIIDLLKQTETNEQQQHYLNLLTHSSKWLSRIISDGLDFTKIEADELIIESIPTNLKEVLHSLSSVYAEVASSGPVHFVTEIDENIPEVVECDQFRLAQVLNNLLANAMKFTNKGKVSFSAVYHKRKADTVTILFSVCDTGVGIDAENITSIFKPFRQGDISTSRHHGGTGLGLAIASRIVKLMGGNIEVKSTPGSITTFSFTLKVKIPANAAVLPKKAGMLSVRWKRKPRILLVEDNDINREVTVNFLEHFCCQASTAANGNAALDLLHKQEFDLILMDCQMPEMDGYEAARKILQMNTPASTTPIIALTAHTTNEDRKNCLAAGMVDYMGKPFRGEELELLLAQWLPDLIAGYEKRLKKASRNDEEKLQTPGNTDGKNLHDLRNCLGAILGAAELALLYRDEPDNLEAKLNTIVKATKQARDLTSAM